MEKENQPIPQNRPVPQFTHGNFSVANRPASYDLPVVEIVQEEQGAVGLKAVGSLRLQYVRSTKSTSQLVLMDRFETDKGPKFGYKDLTQLPEGANPEDAPLITFDNLEELTKVKAMPQEDGKYILDIHDQNGLVGITVDAQGVLTETTNTEEGNVIETFVYVKEVPVTIPAQPGVMTESVLDMMIYDLETKYEELPSFETMQAIINLKQASHWIKSRQMDRSNRGVLNTNKK